MKIADIYDFEEISSARIFRALCTDGNLWVLRCKKREKNSRRLFSEYVSGILSEELGINHPKVQIVDIPVNMLNRINSIENIFDEKCLKSVGTLFIEGIKKFNLKSENKLRFTNSNHIFGYILFIYWVHMSDYYKQENIQKTINNELVFLDFDLSFSSDIEEWGNLPDYDDIKIAINQPSFLEPFTTSLEPFEEWIIKLLSISKTRILNKIGSLPECWQIPPNYFSSCMDFIFDNRSRFIQEFKNSINLKKNLRDEV
ncbi:MAG: hypothetical protein OQK56_07840 [Ignavibacteriaceae bacterium]|jgi:hypothetical protein|nr:hypothetical protein [Ignavibacteriaceae bacterium]MCW9065879.1 hypothetical protein [Ignavibacteriaceae bacterium]